MTVNGYGVRIYQYSIPTRQMNPGRYPFKGYAMNEGCEYWDIGNSAAIHLPQVCRQIYHETATLVYSSNIFVFRHFDLMNQELKAWVASLIPAQRDAITDIELSHSDVLTNFWPMGRNFVYKELLPGLKRIHSFKWVCGIPNPASEELGRQNMRNLLYSREGDSLELVFRDQQIDEAN